MQLFVDNEDGYRGTIIDRVEWRVEKSKAAAAATTTELEAIDRRRRRRLAIDGDKIFGGKLWDVTDRHQFLRRPDVQYLLHMHHSAARTDLLDFRMHQFFTSLLSSIEHRADTMMVQRP